MTKCVHQHDAGIAEYWQCDNHAKLIHNGYVQKSFCKTCPYKTERMEGVGDVLAAGLAAVGITKDRVQSVAKAVGLSDCGCDNRQGFLNEMLPFSAPASPSGLPVVDMSNATRHLTYHVWPTSSNGMWKWNLRQIASRWAMFNGRKVLGLVYGRHCAMPDDVLAYCGSLGIEWDHVVIRRNSPALGEVKTWHARLAALHPETAQPNEVVFAAHAKGVKYSAAVPIIQRWAELGYAASLDCWPMVQQQLTRFAATGPYKKYVGFVIPGIQHWHYSGTFFWFRLADLARRDWQFVDQMYAGTETWIGRHVRTWEAACTFLDHCGMLYDENYWRLVVEPAWEKWERVHDVVPAVCE